MALAVLIHLLSVVIWVGGMFFAWVVLRPAAGQQLDGPNRLRLWNQVFRNFFRWVWPAVVLILLSGYWMIFTVFGGMGRVGLYIHIMQLIGIVMMLIYAYLYFLPYARFRKHVEAEQYKAASADLAVIRRIVGTNLILGLVVIAVAATGRYIMP